MPNQANHAARALQGLGFGILHIVPTLSVQGPKSLWESTFKISFILQKKTAVSEVEGGEVPFQKALIKDLLIPTNLQNLIVSVMFMEPLEYY